MATSKKHQSIEQFKEFVKKHPKLIAEVRKGNKEWQGLFEDWYLLGENDEVWKQYANEDSEKKEEKNEKKSDFFSQIITAVKKMDAEQVNHHIHNMSSTIATLQSLVQQFGGSKGSGQSNAGSNHPFSFRKD